MTLGHDHVRTSPEVLDLPNQYGNIKQVINHTQDNVHNERTTHAYHTVYGGTFLIWTLFNMDTSLITF